MELPDYDDYNRLDSKVEAIGKKLDKLITILCTTKIVPSVYTVNGHGNFLTLKEAQEIASQYMREDMKEAVK